ncbi:molybdenum cofactor guanylyltransferase MobA [Candidatus Pantoea carbekii]|uniref:Molybdenum cofactor guanylyltransferase n=1 Tax=Candidatus Pantoea carbekii TaxID=1235990 RepID=U3U7V5_9GAMM|nr:molybdenum cofactor guanylyltransferase MobA [Candidatus Pantoea carbekii]AKC31884.1 molybdopterin-guanine dinucleotide biosynthesis protein A MobA [Candidatus Pantoea carbekii]BAO00399.1 MobA protein [Candidatus Pantoea carbekii]
MVSFTGVILAGGKSNRMQEKDKGLLIFQHKLLYQHVLQRFYPQVNYLFISANRNINHYESSGFPVITDSIPYYPGPLAGMLSGLYHSQTEWVAFCACDMPFIPINYVKRLWEQRGTAPAVWVKSFIKDHPTLSLVHNSLRNALQIFLLCGERRLKKFLYQQGGHAVIFSDIESVFKNINTPNDLIEKSA